MGRDRKLLKSFGERTLPVEWVGGPGNAIANPVQYFVFPFLLLMLLGARPRELGLRIGWRVWKVCLLWVAIPLISWIVLMTTGQLPFQVLIQRLIGNRLQNGFFEEFLFRGALQMRLKSLLPANWTLTCQALIFGVWHIATNTRMMDGNRLAGLAVCIVSQILNGLFYGIVFMRTRNLIAPSVAHVAMNVFGQSFG